jgi:hypothetical protein
MSGVYDPGRQSARQYRHQIGAMERERPGLGVVRFIGHKGPVRSEQPESRQPHAKSVDALAEAEPVQDSLTVVLERHTRADVSQLTRSFEDPNLRPGLVKRHGCRQSADTAAYDRHS